MARAVQLVVAFLLIGVVPGRLLGQEAPQATQLIRAAEGGQLTAPSGLATLTVPPGALAADTTISLTELTAEEGAGLGPAFELQPDGLQFQKPATLTIRYQPGDLPDGYAPDDVCVATEAALSPEMAALGAGRAMGGGPPGSPAGPPAEPPAPDATEGLALAFLEETAVDPDTGTASVELAHLSRYRLRRLKGHVLGTSAAVLQEGRKGDAWDQGWAYHGAHGAGTARFGYDLAPKALGASILWGKVSCPVGVDGDGVASGYVTKSFRVKRGRAGQARTGVGAVSVALQHAGQIEERTNSGMIHLYIQCMDEAGGPVGVFDGERRPGDYPGYGSWARWLLPAGCPWIPRFAAPYTPDDRHLVRFGRCRLKAGRIYTILVALNLSMLGSAPKDGGTMPPLGGAIEFPRVFGLTAEVVVADSTRAS